LILISTKLFFPLYRGDEIVPTEANFPKEHILQIHW